MKIPFVDLSVQWKTIEGSVRKAIDQVLESRQFIHGPLAESFACEFLGVHGGKYGVGCANGTSAITVCLRALNVGPGDEVLVPNHTFIGTVEPIVEVGAIPVLVDVDSEYHQLDLKDASKKISPKTKCIIPVHLYGMAEPMTEIMAFAKQHKLKVIEDCAQAHLTKWKGQPVGTFGDMATFSFFPGKNLGAFGDAGFILTQNENLFEFAKKYVNHGRLDKYLHEFCGSNVRMDGMQAAILSAKLPHLKNWTERRRELAKAYDERLSGFQVLKPRFESIPSYHLYVVEVSNRDQVTQAFDQAGIGYGIHYPVPMSEQPALKEYAKGAFPVSERMAKRIISMPFFPEMTIDQMQRACDVFLKVARP